ncbi:MAG: thioredoxin fold domain-containing protein [Proteobacteria bacterium]|nr:thioredoxin fold domain-containing protein [Pseudomonadota bacterium]MBU4010698.1 thioredoxin fold domain-containing protein [Pseudomonadota bacterium]
MKKSQTAGLAFSLFLYILLISANAFASDSIQWHKYEEGTKLCNNNQKKMFLYFYSDSCRYCREIEDKTFKDKSIIDIINKNFIPVKINADKEQNLADTYKIRGWPGVLFISEKEDIIFKNLGFIPPDMFLSILKYVYTDSYKTMSLRSYMVSIGSSGK